MTIRQRMYSAYWRALDAMPDEVADFVSGGARVGFWIVGLTVGMFGGAQLLGGGV